jgi:agmatine deiminase
MVNDGSLRTDFSEVTTLFLIYPEGIEEGKGGYENLIEFYDNLIKLVPTSISLRIMVKKRTIGERIKKLRDNLQYIVNSEIQTIWLRDIVGFCRGTTLYKPIFKPKYYWGNFDTAEQINQNLKSIHSLLNFDMEIVPLKWDGGNLITNGEIGFITERVLKDNAKAYSETQVAEIIKTRLGIEPVFLPEYMKDEFGHIDGCLNFISEDKLLIGDYESKEDGPEKDYLKYLREKIVGGYNITVIPITELPYRSKYEGKYIPLGNYINLLKLNEFILLPVFDIPDLDKKNIAVLSQFGKVIPVNCLELAKHGGLLHCISWTI